jgi:hypothetical protein
MCPEWIDDDEPEDDDEWIVDYPEAVKRELGHGASWGRPSLIPYMCRFHLGIRCAGKDRMYAIRDGTRKSVSFFSGFRGSTFCGWNAGSS